MPRINAPKREVEAKPFLIQNQHPHYKSPMSNTELAVRGFFIGLLPAANELRARIRPRARQWARRTLHQLGKRVARLARR